MTVLGQPTVSYTYDSADRLTQLAQGSASVAFAYDTANRRTSLTLPNGVVTGYTYDAASRLTGLSYALGGTPLGTLTYAYDANGQRTVLGGTWAATGLPQPVASATYDAANRQLTVGGLTLSYDLNGNLTSDGTNTYTWDARNQLVAITGASLTASFSYDARGRRQGKTVNSTATQFLYDGLNPVQEQQGGSPVANLLTGLGIDEYLTRTDATGASHVLSDALGSTVALTDATGAVPTTYTYEPFGATTVSGAATTNSFDYTGRETDGTGLKYYRARYYSPVFQRFVSEDPLEFAAGDVNLYAYVFNEPIDRNDPTGEIAPWLLGGLVGAGVDLGLQLLQNGGDIGCVNWGSVAVSGLAGAALGAVGPGGPIFGRAGYGAPRWWGNQNIGNTRFGWSWHQGRNWFGPHGGTPYTPDHWHGLFGKPQLMIPGPRIAANMSFGIGGGAVGGVLGNSMSGRGKCGGGAPSGSSAASASGDGFGGAGTSGLW